MAFTQDTSLFPSKGNFQNLIIPGLIFIVLLFSIWLVIQSKDVSEFPVFITDSFTFTAWVNQGEDFLKDNIKVYTRALASNVKELYVMLEDFLLDSSWVFIVALLLIPSLALGGIKLGFLILFGTMYWGMVGLWDSAMETLALMGLSVFLSVLLGVIIGIFCA